MTTHQVPILHDPGFRRRLRRAPVLRTRPLRLCPRAATIVPHGWTLTAARAAILVHTSAEESGDDENDGATDSDGDDGALGENGFVVAARGGG